MGKNKYFFDLWVSASRNINAKCLVSNAQHIFTVQLYFEKYMLKYKYWNQGFVLKHKIKKKN
jgi:hypothetical protein